MTRTAGRAFAMSLSLLIVAAAGWEFSRTYLLTHFAPWSIIHCDCLYWETPDGWAYLDAGPFRIKAPEGAVLNAERRPGLAVGRIEHPAFALTYYFGFGPDDQSDMRKAADYQEEALEIDGHQAVLRQASDFQSDKPYLAALYVEDAVTWHGTPFSLELHGAFVSPGERALAVRVLKTVHFEDLPDWFRSPPLAYQIERDSAR